MLFRSGFIGEFLILLGAFQSHIGIAAVAVSGVVLGAAYMLWMIKKVFFGPKGEIVLEAEKDPSHHLHDMNWRELVVMAPLVVMIFWMGLFPNQFLNFSKASLDHLLQNKTNYSLAIKQ